MLAALTRGGRTGLDLLTQVMCSWVQMGGGALQCPHTQPAALSCLAVLGTALRWAGARVAPSFSQVIQSLHDVAAQTVEVGQPVAAGPS